MDLLPQIVQIIRDAIKDGLVRGESLRRFNRNVKNLKGPALEDYLQRLWDDFPPDGWQTSRPRNTNR